MKIQDIAKSIRISFNPIPTGEFATVTWDIMAQMIQGAYENRIWLPDYWKIGDSRTVHINEIPVDDSKYAQRHTEQDVTFTILDFNKDQLAIPYNKEHWCSVVTIGMTTPLAETYNIQNYKIPNSNESVRTSDVHYDGSIYQQWCNENLFNALPQGLKNLAKEVIHPNFYYYIYSESWSSSSISRSSRTLMSTTNEKCWFYEYGDIYDGIKDYKENDGYYPVMYTYFKNPDSKIILDNRNITDRVFTRSEQYYVYRTYNTNYLYFQHLGAKCNEFLNQYVACVLAL